MKEDNDATHNEMDRLLPRKWIGCPIEEEYFGDMRKQRKAERKQASEKDRSKYKKTDRAQYERRLASQQHKDEDKRDLKRGRVLSILSQGIIVAYDNQLFTCALRGTLKKEKGLFKNLVTVGDFVLFRLSDGQEGVIHSVEARTSVLSRADNLSQRKEQLIAANIDQLLIVTSVIEPALKSFLVDRYIIAAYKGGMVPVIIVNKVDLLAIIENEEEKERELLFYEEFLNAYRAAGILIITVSTVTGEGIEELKKVMKDKASVFSGQSGVGKSSLINALTGLDLRVGKTVERTKKGSHTTTTAQLIPLSWGGWCIDTPGIKSFGIWDVKRNEVEQYFSEIYEAGKYCKYPTCSHIHGEEDCAVCDAVNEGKISPLRYESYGYLIDSIDREHLRR